MNCQEVIELMQRQLDLDLDRSEQELLEAHIRRCPTCRSMMQRLQRLTSELSSLPKVHPPVSLVDAILPRLAEIDRMKSAASAAQLSVRLEETPGRKGRAADRGRLRNMIMGGVIAAGVLLGVVILNPGENDRLRMADSSGGSSDQSSMMQSMDFGIESAADNAVYSDQSVMKSGVVAQEVSDKKVNIMEMRQNEMPLFSPSDKAVSGEAGLVPGAAPDSLSDADGMLSLDGPAGFIDNVGLTVGITVVDQSGSITGFVSPEGTYSAFIENGAVVILDENHDKLYTSRDFADAEIYDLVWEREGRLLFKVKSGEASYIYFIDLKEHTEGKL